MAAAKSVLQTIFQTEFLQAVEGKGTYLHTQLKNKCGNLPSVKEIRGKGLMVGIVCEEDISSLIPLLIGKGLLALNAGPHVIRLLPPLTVTNKEMDTAVSLIHDVLVENL